MTESGGIVTILFTDVVGSTETLTSLGDVAANEARREHFDLLRGAVAEYRGQEVKSLGDGIMVVFGSALDAVECAVTMQQLAAPTRAEIRMGLHVGEPFREDDDYFGTPVVIASRLCDAAHGGQILASDLVRALVASRGAAIFHDAGYLALKGITDPVAAWEIEWAPVVSGGLPFPSAIGTGQRVPFVGRETELDQLLRDWKAARDGTRTVSLLAGEPGIGKTRLASELATRAYEHGATVLFGRADEEALVPYQPFVEAIDHVLRHQLDEELPALVGDNGPDLARLVPHLRERLPGLPETMRSEPETERYRVFEAVRELFATLTASAPVVLVLDDLHWADKPTLLLLHHLLRPGDEMALHIVGTYRDTDLDRRHPLSEALADMRRQTGFERIALSGLGETDIDQFLDLITGQDPPEGFARVLHDQTEGNPFFIGEVLRHLVESGAVSVVDGEWQANAAGGAAALPIPEGVKEVIGRRLTRLSDEANHVLSVGAVLGRDFDLDVLVKVADVSDDGALNALEAAIGARLVVERAERVGRYHFVHALVRETLYDELTAARRARLHRRAGLMLEELHAGNDEPVLAQLAYHYGEAAQADDVVKAVDYALRAGEAALEMVAYEEAAGHFERALQVLELGEPVDTGARCDILALLADARGRTGDTSGSKNTFATAIDLARELRDPDRFSTAALGFAGNFDFGAGHHDLAGLLEEGDRLFGERETANRSRMKARLCQEFYFDEDRNRYRVPAQAALDMSRRVGDRAAEGYALTMSFALYDTPDQAELRRDLTADALAIGRETNDAIVEHWGRTFYSFALLELGEVEAFEREVDAAETMNARLRLPSIGWYAPLWRAALASGRGDLAEMEQYAIEALTLGQQAEDPVSLQMFGVQFYAMRREQGRLTEVEPTVRSMVEEFPAIPAWRLGLALLLAEMGRSDEAARELEILGAHGFADLPADANWLTSLALISDAVFLTGAAEHAVAAYELFKPYEHRFVAIGQCADWYGSVARCLGELAATCGRLDDAVAHFERGIAADESRRGLRMGVRGRWGLADTLRKRGHDGDGERANAIIEETLPIAEGKGLVVLADRLSALRE